MAAGDWIRMRTSINRDPRVIRMADYIALDRRFMDWLSDPVNCRCSESAYEHVTRNVTIALCVTGLLVTWGEARTQGDRDGDDLIIKCCDAETLSAISGVPGFGDAMVFVGWAIELENNCVLLPKFFKENETPDEKHKRQAAERQAKFREKQAAKSNVTDTVTSGAESNVTVTPREEKRREEKKHTRAAKTPLPLEFSVSESVRTWARENGHDRIQQRLEHFIGYAKANGAKYADWDQAFKNAIRDNWAKLPPAPPSPFAGGK